MKHSPECTCPLFEVLEGRLLLAGFDISDLDPSFSESLSLTLPTDAMATASQDVFTDQGDFYWADGRQIHLLRAANEVVTSFARGENAEELIQQWTQADGPLAGYEVYCPLNDNLFVLGGSAGSPDAASALEAVSAGGKVAWSGPTFMCEETGSRLWATDEVVVAIRPGVDPAAFFAEFGSYTQLFMNQYVLSVQGGSLGSLQTANTLANDPNVEWTSPNFYQDFRVSTNDTLYNSQWNLNNTGQTGAQSDADADVAEAWSTTTGSSDIVIAVLDNGVQTNHPDLNIYTNPGEIAGNSVDDDGNGFVDDVNGWDFTGTGDNNPNPATAYDNHGTAVAGVAAAHGSNGLGVTGVSQHSTILPIKIATDTDGSGGGFVDDATIAQAVYYAGGCTQPEPWRGADIINCSWGGGSPNTTLTNAFDYVAENGRDGLGCAIFVAAGNSASGYRTYNLGGIPAGNWLVEWRYTKDASVSQGDDTVWLANVGLPDGSQERFTSTSLPAGWSSSGPSQWAINSDAAHAYFVGFTGGYQVRAGAIDNGQTTALRSRTVTVSATSSLQFNAWVSTEAGYDKLNVYVSNNGGSTWYGPYFGASGIAATNTAVSYPASLDSTIAVGASTDWDYRAAYGQYGSALDFVAPSSGGYAGIITTDRTGAAGYNPAGDYTDTAASAFGGTSSAAPLAAGIGAFLLSENPGLTATQIRDIMRASADQIGNVTYTSGFNSYYGYGRVNADAALDSIGPDITADIADVSPDPRDTSVDSIAITFTQSVNNFDLADLTLEREGQTITLGTGVSLTADNDYDTFTLSGISGLTGDPGKYELILTANGSLITGAGTGDYLSGDATDVWYMNTVSGGSGSDAIVVSKDGSHIKIDINNGTTVYLLDFSGFPALNINGLGGNDTLTVDLADGNPISAAGITFNGGDDTDTLEIIGSTGGDTITLTGGTPAASSYEIGVANVEAFIASLGAGDDTLNLKDGAYEFEFAAGDFSLGDGEDILSVTDATVTLNDNVGASASDDSDTVETHGDANLTFNVTQYLKSLQLFDESVVTLDGDGGDAIVTTELKINENQTLAARLDLTDNNLVVDYAGSSSPVDTIRDYLVAGYNKTTQYWTGNGIVSSTADGKINATTLGYIDDTTAKTVTVKYTYLGDLNLDGVVTLTDLSQFISGFNSGGALTGWQWGDLNYDGAINLTDLSLFISGFNEQGGPLG